MRAVVAISGPLIERDIPAVAAGEVRIKVAFAGVNRADVLQAAGYYPPPPGASDVLGLECSGTIDAVGEGVSEFAVGDEVCALLSGGGYAEFVTAPAGQVAHLPDGLTLEAAAGVMETAATVWSNVFDLAHLSAGELLLVHGGSSGIGTTAIQIAKALGADVAVTVSSQAKAQACRDLGADIVINYREEDFVEVLKDHGRRADVILDNMGAKYLERNVAALNINGRLVVIGLQGGVSGELPLSVLLNKRASVSATSLRARPDAEKTAIVADVVEHVWPLISAGKFRPIIHEVIDFSQAARAHQILTESSHIGKVILSVNKIS